MPPPISRTVPGSGTAGGATLASAGETTESSKTATNSTKEAMFFIAPKNITPMANFSAILGENCTRTARGKCYKWPNQPAWASFIISANSGTTLVTGA